MKGGTWIAARCQKKEAVMRLRKIPRRAITPVTIVAMACLTLAGTMTASSASSAASTRTINVLLATQLTGGSLYPEVGPATLAAVKEINATGGIHGHKVVLTTCDNQSQVNVDATCAQEAVANHDVAVLGNGNVEDTTMLPILQHAHIAEIGQDESSALGSTEPIAFPGATGGFGLSNAAGPFLKRAGCTKVSAVIISGFTATAGIAAAMKASIEGSGLTYVGPTYSPITQTDFTSTMEAITLSGADCITGGLAISQTQGLLTAWKASGSTIKMVLPGTIVPPASAMASIDSGVYLFSPLRLPSDPVVKPVAAAIKKWEPQTTITQRAIEAYDYTMMFASALRKANPKTYTNRTVLAALNHISNYSPLGNVFHPYSTNKPIPGNVGNRTFNHWCIEYQANGATTTVTSGWIAIPTT
jgi:ABC-type branched-subunit amino acid transport system substrate-binding protein